MRYPVRMVDTRLVEFEGESYREKVLFGFDVLPDGSVKSLACDLAVPPGQCGVVWSDATTSVYRPEDAEEHWASEMQRSLRGAR